MHGNWHEQRCVGMGRDKSQKPALGFKSSVQFPPVETPNVSKPWLGSLQSTEQHGQHVLFEGSWHKHRTWWWFLTARLYYKKNTVSTEIPWAEVKDIQTRTALPVLLQNWNRWEVQCVTLKTQNIRALLLLSLHTPPVTPASCSESSLGSDLQRGEPWKHKDT